MKLFVFDLDFTLWDAGGTWCDATNPPYYWSDGALLDQSNSEMELYADVIPVLEELKKNKRKIAAASRTFEPSWAQDLLHLFDIDKYFDLKEIYPSSKIQHFSNIKKYFGIDYSDMVFFDDEHRNILEVGKLGVEAVLVNDGLRKEQVFRYLK
ncbi:magnesium-dependent phosphatase-1 [Draconibacterium sp.]|uniref:magnesium-dependent phosphatase-1 n=1 Tax=Draconibacterium sp. TaxID=1965318 RepID=UPI0035651A03